MKKRQITIAALVLAAVFTIAFVAWGTMALLRSSGKQTDARTSGDSASQGQDKELPMGTNKFEEPEINEDLNKKALAVDAEAAGLMESNPSTAQQKYMEAAQAYRDAGNVSKASEMEANAMTAGFLTEQQTP